MLPAGDGAEPFIDAQDIAEVAAAALTGPGHAGRIYELTGPRALTFTEAVSVIGGALGTKIAFTDCTSAEFVATMVGWGVPEPAAAHQATLFERIRNNIHAEPTEDVRRVLGRPPTDFATVVAKSSQLRSTIE